MRQGITLMITFLFFGAATVPFLTVGQSDETRKSVLELNDSIVRKKEEIDKLQKQADIYKKNITVKQQEASTLANQLSIIDTRMKEHDVRIAITKKEIEETQLELDATRLEIVEREQEIALAKARLEENIRTLEMTTRHSPLAILLARETIAAVVTHVKSIELVQAELLGSLADVRALKGGLEATAKAFTGKQETLEHLGERLTIQRTELVTQRGYRQRVLNETKEKEALFQDLLAQLRAEQQAIDAEIGNLERTIREKLKLIDQSYQGNGGKLLFSWPVNPARGISAYFHDPSYPFRNIFEHPAIDIRTPQGTGVQAAAPGYVARAKDGGMGYSYVMLIHPGGYATVYGHVSRILVKEDAYVDRGDIVALSGGAPGTPGAGKLTTGPHLHFEVRLNGIPVNPLDGYLF